MSTTSERKVCEMGWEMGWNYKYVRELNYGELSTSFADLPTAIVYVQPATKWAERKWKKFRGPTLFGGPQPYFFHRLMNNIGSAKRDEKGKIWTCATIRALGASLAHSQSSSILGSWRKQKTTKTEDSEAAYRPSNTTSLTTFYVQPNLQRCNGEFDSIIQRYHAHRMHDGRMEWCWKKSKERALRLREEWELMQWITEQ